MVEAGLVQKWYRSHFARGNKCDKSILFPTRKHRNGKDEESFCCLEYWTVFGTFGFYCGSPRYKGFEENQIKHYALCITGTRHTQIDEFFDTTK